MYLKYYNLYKEPFKVTLNRECVCTNPSHEESLATIICGVESPTGEGYSKPEIEMEAEASTQKLTSKFEGDASSPAKNSFLVKRILKQRDFRYSPVQEFYGAFYKELTGEVRKQSQRISKDNKILTGERLIFPEPAKVRSLEDNE